MFGNSTAPREILRGFETLQQWREWWAAHPEVSDQGYIKALVEHGVRNGIAHPFLGAVGPREITVAGTNYREDYVARGFNARQRSLLHALEMHFSAARSNAPKIYAHEALTPLALLLRGRYPFFVGSEFAPDPVDQARIFPIPHVDAADTGFPDDAFDVVLSSDVLEHVPDVEAALRETARILKPRGVFLATFPFSYGAMEATDKARLENGAIEYLCEPEYHGNPLRPDQGSLVFSIPGWSVLEVARRSGFERAEMVFDSSPSRGCTGAELAGVFILKAYA